MQQTKRRSRKGVILLAMAFALFVLAIVPASALAAGSITVNGVAGATTVGSNLVNVGYMSTNPLAAYVTFQVTAAGPGAYGLESTPRKAYGPTGTWNYETISLGTTVLPLQMFKVKVNFYAALTGGTAIDPVESGILSYNNSKSVSELDWNAYGARGDVIPIAPVYPPALPNAGPFADYGTTWFGPGWGYGTAGYNVAAGPYQTARADFYLWGATPHSVVYQVDDLYQADILANPASGPPTWVPGAPGLFTNPIPFYGLATPYPATGGSASAILKSDGTPWSSSPPLRDGFHWIDHYGVAATGLTDGPISRAPFGYDSVRPRWTINGVPLTPAKVWYGPGDVKFDALATDEPGSGVATATITTPDGVIGTHPLEWTWWQLQADASFRPTAAWDAFLIHGPAPVSFNATDAVGNTSDLSGGFWFDLTPPHTSHTSEPATATSAIWNPNWTNTDVKVTFHAMDPGYNDGWGSGVAYTEYVIGSSTSTPPGQASSGTKGDSVTITKTAPTGPVYLWFRSVDNVGNREVWQKIFVYIDKIAPGTPGLENDVPGWWINDGDAVYDTTNPGGTPSNPVVPILFGFNVWFDATDLNSGIGPDLIQWRILNWMGSDGLWHQIAPNASSPTFFVHANAADDGIYALESAVTDRAGNVANLSSALKIDTRPPVTKGTEGSPVTGAASTWINGLEPYQLTATDQVIGAGVAATVYRVDQSTPWQFNTATTVGTTLVTNITLTGGQGAMHTVDFGSVDAALPYWFNPDDIPMDANDVPSWTWGNTEGTGWVWNGQHGFIGFNGYKTASVKLDVTAPVVTAMDPKNGNWQKGPAVVNFSGTDVGAGYAYTEWKTSGTDWAKGEVASVGGDGEITVTYHGVDKVGIKSADQTIVVKVASTRPSLTGGNVSVRKGGKATFMFNITAVTPTATSVVIEIRNKATGRTYMTKRYANVTTNSDQTRSFRINLKKGKYNIRIGATDAAGNVQAKRGGGTLTVR